MTLLRFGVARLRLVMRARRRVRPDLFSRAMFGIERPRDPRDVATESFRARPIVTGTPSRSELVRRLTPAEYLASLRATARRDALRVAA